MKVNPQNFELTPDRLAYLEKGAPDWVRVITEATVAKARAITTHYTTFGGDAQLLQIALVYADRHHIRVMFATTMDAYAMQLNDKTAGYNLHHNAIPAEDFRYEVEQRMKKERGEDGKRP